MDARAAEVAFRGQPMRLEIEQAGRRRLARYFVGLFLDYASAAAAEELTGLCTHLENNNNENGAIPTTEAFN
ncbi:hypothetical protein D3C72_2018390 [compost metagenome]